MENLYDELSKKAIASATVPRRGKYKEYKKYFCFFGSDTTTTILVSKQRKKSLQRKLFTKKRI